MQVVIDNLESLSRHFKKKYEQRNTDYEATLVAKMEEEKDESVEPYVSLSHVPFTCSLL